MYNSSVATGRAAALLMAAKARMDKVAEKYMLMVEFTMFEIDQSNGDEHEQSNKLCCFIKKPDTFAMNPKHVVDTGKSRRATAVVQGR